MDAKSYPLSASHERSCSAASCTASWPRRSEKIARYPTAIEVPMTSRSIARRRSRVSPGFPPAHLFVPRSWHRLEPPPSQIVTSARCGRWHHRAGSENRADRVEVVPAAFFADEPGPLVQDLQLPLVQ